VTGDGANRLAGVSVHRRRDCGTIVDLRGSSDAALQIGGALAARVLVAFASKLGSNGEIAEAIADTLRGAGHHAAAHPVREVRSLDGWDAVVLGSAIYAAHWQRDARRFVTHHRDALALRLLWLYSSGPLDARLARANLPISDHAAAITEGLGALGHRTFGGRLRPDADIDPQVLRTHPIGDFRDWDAIRAYAREIATSLAERGFQPAATAASAG
jgi:menaquinone-dependent protoporphyrinogen oxidase